MNIRVSFFFYFFLLNLNCFKHYFFKLLNALFCVLFSYLLQDILLQDMVFVVVALNANFLI